MVVKTACFVYNFKKYLKKENILYYLFYFMFCRCFCLPGFGGSVCQINYDDCLPLPKCLNSGQCVDGINGYSCVCPNFTTGRNCENFISASTFHSTDNLKPSSNHLTLLTSFEASSTMLGSNSESFSSSVTMTERTTPIGAIRDMSRPTVEIDSTVLSTLYATPLMQTSEITASFNGATNTLPLNGVNQTISVSSMSSVNMNQFSTPSLPIRSNITNISKTVGSIPSTVLSKGNFVGNATTVISEILSEKVKSTVESSSHKLNLSSYIDTWNVTADTKPSSGGTTTYLKTTNYISPSPVSQFFTSSILATVTDVIDKYSQNGSNNSDHSTAHSQVSRDFLINSMTQTTSMSYSVEPSKMNVSDSTIVLQSSFSLDTVDANFVTTSSYENDSDMNTEISLSSLILTQPASFLSSEGKFFSIFLLVVTIYFFYIFHKQFSLCE